MFRVLDKGMMTAKLVQEEELNLCDIGRNAYLTESDFTKNNAKPVLDRHLKLHAIEEVSR